MARQPSWSNFIDTNSFIYLLSNFLSRKKIGPRKSENLIYLFGKRSWKQIGPRKSENLIHVFGKRSWKQIGPRKNENLIHVFGKRSWKQIGPRKSENLKGIANILYDKTSCIHADHYTYISQHISFVRIKIRFFISTISDCIFSIIISCFSFFR